MGVGVGVAGFTRRRHTGGGDEDEGATVGVSEGGIEEVTMVVAVSTTKARWRIRV